MAEVLHKAPEKIAAGNAETEMKLLEEAVSRAICEPEKRLIIDMAETRYLSSAGIRNLLTTFKRMRAAGGEFILRNVSSSVLEIINLTGIKNLIRIE